MTHENAQLEPVERQMLEQMRHIGQTPGGSFLVGALLLVMRLFNHASEDLRSAQMAASALAEVFGDLPDLLESQAGRILTLQEFAELADRAWRKHGGTAGGAGRP